MQTVTSYSGTIHLAVGSKFNRTETACDMHFAEPASDGEQEDVTCIFCKECMREGKPLTIAMREI
jgi:hypothetical protein